MGRQGKWLGSHGSFVLPRFALGFPVKAPTGQLAANMRHLVFFPQQAHDILKQLDEKHHRVFLETPELGFDNRLPDQVDEPVGSDA
jgi:hypothetical protein